jgi:hypothetical protein
MKALRSYSRHVNSHSAAIHIIAPHTYTQKVHTWKKLGTGKNAKKQKVTKVVDTKRKRKIVLAALLDVRGNVIFKKKKSTKKHPKAHKKGQKGKKGKKDKKDKKDDKKPAATPAAVCILTTFFRLFAYSVNRLITLCHVVSFAYTQHAGTGTAFIEDLMIVSKRAQSGIPKLTRPNLGSVADLLAARTSEHEYHHQWRLVYDDVENGWMTTTTTTSTSAAGETTDEPALSSCAVLRDEWTQSSVPAVMPRLAFDGETPAKGRTVHQTFGDLPEHTLIAVSGTFHFLGT